MYKLSFTSSKTSSRHPLRVEGELAFHKKVRKTIVDLYDIDANGDEELIKTTEVVCHPKETDYPLLGKKYAVAKLCSSLGTHEVISENGEVTYKRTDAGSKLREAIWEAFRAHSKKAACITGCHEFLD